MRPDPDVNQNITRQWMVFATPRYSICHRRRLFLCQLTASFDSYLNHVFHSF